MFSTSSRWPLQWELKISLFYAIIIVAAVVLIVIFFICPYLMKQSEGYSAFSESSPAYNQREDFMDTGEAPSSYFEGTNTSRSSLNRDNKLRIPSAYGGGEVAEEIDLIHNPMLYSGDPKELEVGISRNYVVYDGMNKNFPPVSGTAERKYIDMNESKKISRGSNELNEGIFKFK